MRKITALLMLVCLLSPVFAQDQKITSLTPTTSAAAADVLYIVINPGSSPASRKITTDDLFTSRTGNKSVLAYASLAAAVSAIGSSVATIEIPATTAVSADLVIPANVTLIFTGTGNVSVSVTKTLTVNGPLQAPLRQVFSGSGSVILNAPGQPVVCQWFGGNGDGKIVTDASVSGSTITSASASFTSAITGMKFDLAGAGAAAQLSAVIVSVTNTTHAVVNVAASYSGSSKTVSLDSATIASGSMTAGGTTITVGSAFFVVGRDEGKIIRIADVGARNITGTLTYSSSTTATMSVSASVGVSGRRLVCGSNNQAAIARTVAALPNGGHIYFPAGNYVVGSSTTITSNLLVTGAGQNASVIYGLGPKMLDSSTDYDIFRVGNNTSNVGFRELGLSGSNWTAQTTTFGSVDSSGVYVDTSGISNISADRCRFDSFWGIGFHAPGSSGTAIMSSSVVKDISITNCTAAYNSYDGLNANPWSGLIVKNCYLHHNGTAGLEASTGLADISGNICYYNFQGGLSIGGYGSTQTSDSVSVAANDCQFNGAYGITLASNQASTSVVGNTCRANGYAGIGAIAGGDGVDKNSIIASNVCSSNGSFGMLLGHAYTLVQGNKCYDAGITGYSQGVAISVGGSNCMLNANDLSGTGGSDVLIAGANTWFGEDNVYDPSKFQASGSGSLSSPTYRGYVNQLPNTTATGFVDIALPTDTVVSGTITYQAYQTGGAQQIRSGIARFSASNNAGTYATEIVIVNEGVSVSSGTLTLSLTVVSGSNKITLKATGNSSVFGGGVHFRYTIHNESTQAITPL